MPAVSNRDQITLITLLWIYHYRQMQVPPRHDCVMSTPETVVKQRSESNLRFVCQREMAGQTSELTEFLIGTKALGRPEDFSPEVLIKQPAGA